MPSRVKISTYLMAAFEFAFPTGKILFFRAAFRFGRRVHFALRRKMLKLPIARLLAIKLDLTNRPSGKTDCIYKANVK